MRGLRELELHLDHTDMGTPELKLLGKSFSSSTLKRLCLDLRSCYILKQDCRLNLNSRSCTQKTPQTNRAWLKPKSSETRTTATSYISLSSIRFFFALARARKTGGMFPTYAASIRSLRFNES